MKTNAAIAKYAKYAAAALTFAAFLSICANVYLYGDDFFYSTFSQHGLGYYVSRHIQHYSLANGRVIVHLLATAFLALDIWVWRVTNALALTACVLLAALPRRESQAPAGRILLAAAALLMTDTLVTRQSAYWLTGSFNYVYPCLMLLVYWRVLERSMDGGRLWPAVPLAFLAAATNEQGGLMTFGLTLLMMLWALFFKKQKPRAAHYAALALAAVGFLTVVLSPGLAHRADVAGTDKGGLALVIGNLPGALRAFLFGSARRANVVMLAAAALYLGMGLKAVAPRIRTIRFVAACAAVCAMACVAAAPEAAGSIPDAGVTPRFALYTAATAIGYAAGVFGCGAFMLADGGGPRAITAALLGVGSQIAMTASPVSGPRTVWCYIVMASVFACEAAFAHKAEKRSAYIRAILLAAAVAFAAFNWRTVFTGYNENGAVYSSNLAAVESYAAAPSGELAQTRLPVENCAWVMPYHNSYYDPYYNLCYGLPQDTNAVWK